MSEGGNNTIRNVMTLEVGQFDTALENTQKKLQTLDKGLDKTAQQAALLEGSLSNLFSNIGNVNNQFTQLGQSLSTVLSGMNSNAKATATATRKTKQLSDESKTLVKTTDKAAQATDRLSDFTKRYNDNLESLNKTTKKGTEQQNKLKDAVEDFSKTKSAASKRAIKNSEKELKTSVKNNEKALKDQRKALTEITKMQREAEQKLAQAQADFNRRFFGKNRNSTSAKANEMRAGIEAVRQELSAVNAMRERVAGVVNGLEAKNISLKNSLDLSVRQNQSLEAQIALKARLKIAQDELNKAAREQLRIEREQVKQKDFVGPMPATRLQQQEMKRYTDPSKFIGPYPANHPSNVLPYGMQVKATQKAINDYLASPNFMGPLPATRQQIRDMKRYSDPANFVGPYPANHPNNVLSYGKQQQLLEQEARQKAAMHREQMANLREQQRQQQLMHREQMTFAKELAAMYAAIKVNQSVGGAIHKNSELEQAQFRVSLWNLPKDEEERFISKSKELTKIEKYLTHAEALDARLDALAAMGGNHESAIDGTIATATRVAHILRATGNESGTNSDLIKNLYGFAEARQVTNNVDEMMKSFETILKISNISNGKIKVADIETVARNMGGMRSDVSAEGWLGIAALAEQFKTAGGGNGGGGGVATVGTMLKMMGLYASGKTITNRAVMDLMGADILNEFKDGDAEKAFKENSKQIKEFTKMMKNAGFKDTKAMGQDPVKFFAGLRGQILDYMMRDGNFERYFGQGTERWTYDAGGRMIKKDGTVVDADEQNRIEKAGFTRWASQMGWSNRTVDGMTTMLDKRFIDRANEVVESGKRSADSTQALAAAQQTLKGNMDNLVASLGRLAEAFAPLLPYVTGLVQGITVLINAFTKLVSTNEAVATITGFGLAAGAAALSIKVFIGKVTLIPRLLSAMIPGFKGVSTQVGIFGKNSLTAAGQVVTMGSRVTGIVGGLLKWAGWAGLAATVGIAVYTWLRDINNGEKPLQSSFQRLVQGWKDTLSGALWQMQVWVNEFLAKINWTADAAQRRLLRLRAFQSEVEQGRQFTIPVKGMEGQEGVGFKSDRQTRDYGQRIVDELQRLEKAQARSKDPSRLLDAIRAKGEIPKIQKRIEGLRAELKERGMVFVEKGEYAGTVVYRHELEKNNKAIKDKRQQEVEQKRLMNGTYGSTLPTPSALADYSAPATLPGGGSKEKPERGEREWNNLFLASYQDILSRTAKKVNLYEELGKAPDYWANAMEEFKRKWAKGEFDDNNDPRSRKFTKGSYDPNTGWNPETQIDWVGRDPKSGITVMQWLEAEAERARRDDLASGLKYAAERVGAGRENVENAFADYALGGDSNSTAAEALRRQFARQEVKTPVVKDNEAYQGYKREAITSQAIVDYTNYATQTLKINEQLQIDLLESEAERRRRSAELTFNEEAKKVDALRAQIDLQIKEYERLGKTEEEVYKKAVEAKAKMEKDFTERLALENQKRIRANEDAIQQMMRQWRDLGAAMESTTANWLGDTAKDITAVITGEIDIDDLNPKQWIASLLDGFAGDLVKSAMGNLYKTAMGNANIIDMAKQLWNGEAVTGGGALTGWLNKIRGIENPVGDDTATLTGDAALNQNTLSLNSLRSTIQSLIGVIKGSPVEDVVAGAIGADGAEAAGAAGEAGSGGGFFSDLFSSIKTGFSNLFSSSGEGGIFSTIKNGFSNLFSEGGGLMSKIGGAFSSLFGSFGNVLGGLLGGGGGGGLMGKLGGAFSGAMQGHASGGWAGALAGGISALFSAKGNAFGQSGYITAFAKGGAFTNGVFNQPTPFMFADGGAFGRLGVMGEAGPEAVMPLTRDSSGRLGVTANGFGGGMENTQNNVSIVINVSQEGGDSVQASGDANQNWKQMANSVRALVVEELAKQSRPGGINYRK